jgi:hypothetical protein
MSPRLFPADHCVTFKGCYVLCLAGPLAAILTGISVSKTCHCTSNFLIVVEWTEDGFGRVLAS